MTDIIGIIIFVGLVLFAINHTTDGGVKRAAKWLWDTVK